MKNILFAFVVLFWTTHSLAQSLLPKLQFRPYENITPHKYGIPENFTTKKIADDFGPRKYKNKDGNIIPYNWHGGVDFNSSGGVNSDGLGDLILSPTSGKINKHGVGGRHNRLKWITLEGDDGNNYIFEQ
jgi:hypothetical protein